MADISFKISGSSQPFLAQLWNNDCSLLIQQKPIEYSGTCVVFGGLNGNTTYNLNVIDNISLSVSHTFNTLTQLIPPILPIKFVSLLGTLTCPDSYTRQITSPKYVCVNPPLTNGESVDLKFNIQTVNTSNTINSIDLYCNGNILSPSYINCGSTTKLINMKYGDTICYNISSYCSSSGNICGHSILELTGVTGYGFSACTDSNYCKSTNLSVPTTTTTTTTTLEPITVSMCNINQLSTSPTSKLCYCAKLGTSRPLVAGESFRLYHTNCARSITYVTHTEEIKAYASTYPPTDFNRASSNVCAGILDGCTISQYNYIDVCSSNINNIVFWAVADKTTISNSSSHLNDSYVCFNNITCKCGANFNLGSISCLSACI